MILNWEQITQIWNFAPSCEMRAKNAVKCFEGAPVLFSPLAAQAGRGAAGAGPHGLGDVQVRLHAPRPQGLQLLGAPGGPGRGRGRYRTHAARSTFSARTHSVDWSPRAARPISASTTTPRRPALDQPASTLTIHAEPITIITQISFCHTLFLTRVLLYRLLSLPTVLSPARIGRLIWFHRLSVSGSGRPRGDACVRASTSDSGPPAGATRCVGKGERWAAESNVWIVTTHVTLAARSPTPQHFLLHVILFVL